MIKSMTGYGQGSGSNKNLSWQVEIKTLNSKSFDLNLKIPSEFSAFELTLRNFLKEVLHRGKVAFSLNVDYKNAMLVKKTLNDALASAYFTDLTNFCQKHKLPEQDMLNAVMRMPDIYQSANYLISEEDWEDVFESIKDAVDKTNNFREQEGKAMEKSFRNNILNLTKHKSAIEHLKSERVERIRSRLVKRIEELKNDNQVDENKLEQELVYYVEKLDISEEIIRLDNHFDYFNQTLNQQHNGRKLNFICQELGREINTIGSKANDFEIQKLVVQMKDELEQIKEQVLNVL